MEIVRHYLKPARRGLRVARHLVVWQEHLPDGVLVKPGARLAWDIVFGKSVLKPRSLLGWADAADLEAVLDECSMGKGTLTVWLARGWEDFVLTGLADLVDVGALTYRYISLESQRLLLRGLWRGKSIVVTTLGNWLGADWRWLVDGAADRVVDSFVSAIDDAAVVPPGQLPADARAVLRAWCAVAGFVRLADIATLPATVAGASMSVWRTVLGPRFEFVPAPAGAGKKTKKQRPIVVVAPSPFRPRRAALAERHASYGLPQRQLRRGHVNETVYVADLKSAYGLALATTLLPGAYSRTLHRPDAERLGEALMDNVACALVRVRSSEACYPVRRARRTFMARGSFWSWLAGMDLVRAVASGDVVECQTAYLWHPVQVNTAQAMCFLGLTDACRKSGAPVMAAVWRACYSALVGQFAGRRKKWVDSPRQTGHGRWSAWIGADHRTGELTYWRSIAGRVQQLAEQDDTGQSVPLFYAVITAAVRRMLDVLMGCAGVANVVAINADALLVTAAGWQSLQATASSRGCSPDNLTVKAIYDKVWMDGRSSMITERDGVRSLRAPGLPAASIIGDSGDVRRMVGEPWNECGTPSAARGVRRRPVNYRAAKLLHVFAAPATVQPFGELLDEPLLDESLLLPESARRRVDDE